MAAASVTEPVINRPTKRVACAWIQRGEFVLVTQRQAHGHLAGKWEFPGGKAEPRETLALALARELNEELGIDAVVGQELGRVVHDYEAFSVELVLFDIPYFSGAIRHLEVADSRWVSNEWLVSNPDHMPPADVPLIQQALAKRRGRPSVEEALAVAHAVHQQQQLLARAPLAQRMAAVRRLGSLLQRDRDMLVSLCVLEMGKTSAEAESEIDKCSRSATYFAEQAEQQLAPIPLRPALSARRAEQRLEALGVVLAVMPWNFPYWQILRAALPMWLVGNGVLHKPAPQTTACAYALQKLIDEAFLSEIPSLQGPPCAVVAVDDAVTHALIDCVDIAGVTLTGSERAGRAVAATAGAALKKCVLELGGSDPFVVWSDADISHAASVAAQSRLQNAGQTCVAAKRFFVARSVFDRFVKEFIHAAERFPVAGLVSPRQHALLSAEVEAALTPVEGQGRAATLLWQSKRSPSNQSSTAASSGAEAPGEVVSSFYPPTLLLVNDLRARIWREELFGPVGVVYAFDDSDETAAIEDVVGHANDSRFGLAAAIFTANEQRFLALASRLMVGTVTHNGMTVSDPALPFGGVKNSGFGRELSGFGFTEFARVCVHVHQS